MSLTLHEVDNIADGGQLGQAGDIDDVAVVVLDGGQHGVVSLNITAHGGDGGTVDVQVDFSGADDAVSLLELFFRLADEVLIGVFRAFLEEHDLIVGVVAALGRGQFQRTAKGGVLGHLAHRPDGGLVVDGDAVLGGVAGVRRSGGAAVDHEGQYKIGQCAQQDDDAHGQQQAGRALLRGVALVDVFRHEGMSSS